MPDNKLNEEELMYLPKVYEQYKSGIKESEKPKLTPPEVTVRKNLPSEEYKKYEAKGLKMIKEGKVAVVTMAGGQGTRLGHTGPKGTFVVDPETGKSLFQLLKERIYKVSEGTIPWYIMTSHINHEETVEYFEKNGYFGYPKENIKFFIQERVAVLDLEGRPVYEEDGMIMRTPNGNGGCIKSLRTSGMLSDMEKRGTEYLFISGIDNCLVRPAEPLFAGFAAEKGCDISAKSVLKANSGEKAGTVCFKNGRPGVVEYTEISKEDSEKLNEKGEFKFGEANILSYFLKMDFVKKAAFGAPRYHPAIKELEYFRYEGKSLTREKGQCIKSELFLFDLFELGETMSVLRIEREEEFAPVKNKTGVDSAETALELLRKTY